MSHRVSSFFAFITAALLLTGCGGGGPESSSQSSPPPSLSTPSVGLVFALMNPGDSSTTLNHYASMPQVDGIAFRDRWSRLEPQSNQFNWTPIDQALASARLHSKRLTLHIGVDTPAWLSSEGVAFYSYSNQPLMGSGSAPIPWDSTFQLRYQRFISALVQHLLDQGDLSFLHSVSIGFPVSEMSLPACSHQTLGDSTPYSRSAYLESWKSIIEHYQSAFSTSRFPSLYLAVSAPVAQICRPDSDGTLFYYDLFTLINPDPRMTVFMADLNAQGSLRSQSIHSNLQSIPKHFQTIWSSTNDPTNRFQGSLRQAACQSWNLGARYLEIYPSDLDSASDLNEAVSSARYGQGCS